MQAIANALALSELSAALNAVDAPFSTLPEVKNKDGDPITDVKEKRLALVKQHVKAAGDIINAAGQVQMQADLAVQTLLQTKFRPQIEAMLKAQGLPVPPPGLGGGMLPPGFAVEADPDCNCPACEAKRAALGDKSEDEPGRVFGFGAAAEAQRKAKEEAEKKKTE